MTSLPRNIREAGREVNSAVVRRSLAVAAAGATADPGALHFFVMIGGNDYGADHAQADAHEAEHDDGHLVFREVQQQEGELLLHKRVT